MSRNIKDYLAQKGPPTITAQVFPRNESDETKFSKFHCKRILPNGEAVGQHGQTESFASTGNILVLDVHSHYNQYMLSGRY